MRTFNSV
nr:unnamed protein product [Callosobruchus analis]CAI5838522.1 unnamed protein product [Callosobruchus analis]